MNAPSLRLRLLLGASAWIAVALLLAGLAIVLIFASSIERDRYEDLAANLDRVLTGVSAIGPLVEIDPGLNDPRYVTPAGGLYWQVLDLGTGETARSRSLWDASLSVPAPAGRAPDMTTTAGPSNQLLDALTQDVSVSDVEGIRRLRVTVAEDSAIRGRDIRDFALDIAVALLALGAALMLAGWLTVHLGLQPLYEVRGELESVIRGKATKLAGAYPREVMPLVEEVNGLLDAQERSIALARARADDLAHGLKTPLAVLGATASRLRDRGDVDNAQVLDMLGDEMAMRVDYQLRVSHLRPRSGDHALSASLDQALLRSVAVLRKTGRGEELFWEVDAKKVAVDMDPHDLMELIGVLLENAAKWAASEVRISCRQNGGMAELELGDDGPGLTAEQIASLGERGKRLDEARSGTGFGIAIAKEILTLNRGTIAFSSGPGGGLQIAIRVPAV